MTNIQNLIFIRRNLRQLYIVSCYRKMTAIKAQHTHTLTLPCCTNSDFHIMLRASNFFFLLTRAVGCLETSWTFPGPWVSLSLSSVPVRSALSAPPLASAPRPRQNCLFRPRWVGCPVLKGILFCSCSLSVCFSSRFPGICLGRGCASVLMYVCVGVCV